MFFDSFYHYINTFSSGYLTLFEVIDVVALSGIFGK